MNFLVIGSGGREHAIAWRLAQSPKTKKIYVAPGNAGTQFEPKVENVAIDALALSSLIEFALSHQIDCTVVGPEAPLAAGIVDEFRKNNLLIVGPNQVCAQLESSKAFAKKFMKKQGIPTAQAEVFNDMAQALSYLESVTFPIVIKADGLAAGKGVIIAQNFNEAKQAVTSMLSENSFGEAGHRVVIETFLKGIEASYMVITDGNTITPLASSQDHKARDDGDKGPNTGGMGAFSPAAIITPELEEKILETVIKPVLRGFETINEKYTGFLYAGLMIDESGHFNVLEFNCRLGDPETQPILMRLESDFSDLCYQAALQHLDSIKTKWNERAAVGVVLAAKGYPYKYKKGETLQIPNQSDERMKLFHSGTLFENEKLKSNGGRVLTAVALGENFKVAQKSAYQLAQSVKWEGGFYRNDIGNKAIETESA